MRRFGTAGVAIAISAAAVLVASRPAVVRADSDVKAKYEKKAYMIPMRDGVKLYTVVYSPRDTSRTYPIMFDRTPYSVGPYGDDAYKTDLGPSSRFQDEGFIFAYQDVRGKYMSEGEFVDVRPEHTPGQKPDGIDESTDTYDTIDYLVKNVPNNNGRVGMWGISYPGFYTAAGAIDAHPALKAVSPQAPVSEWFRGADDFHHNGAFFLIDAFSFYSSFGVPRTKPSAESGARFDFGSNDAYQYFLELGALSNANARYFKGNIGFWNDLMKHGTYDAFWQARSLEPRLRDIKPAVMTVGGWFDAEDLYGALHVYDAIERQSPKSPRNMLVMGPWFHGGWARSPGDRLGDIEFGGSQSEYYRDNVEYPFFAYYLEDKGTADLPEAVMFETGSNTWKKFDVWPPKGLQTREAYFGPNATLAFTKPSGGGDADEYVSDPANPVPFTSDISIRRSREFMVEDQRFASRRPDVLEYSSDVLSDDMTVAGPIVADLFASMTGTDADFVVKVIDVFPNEDAKLSGYQMLVRWEIMRGKFRESFEHPKPFKPGEVTPVRVELNDVLHTFKKGHRMMVQVQSSMFPLVDRNPQIFTDIYAAKDSDFTKSTIRVFHSAKYPSKLTMGVLKD